MAVLLFTRHAERTTAICAHYRYGAASALNGDVGNRSQKSGKLFPLRSLLAPPERLDARLSRVGVTATFDRMETYHQRQADMEGWYEALLDSGGESGHELLADYEPHATVLSTLRGRILDLGGGAGLAAAFLAADVEYVVVDPSPIWSSNRWQALSARLRGNGPTPQFVTAPGEAIPLGSGSFDAAISFWALNHVRDPQRCVAEIARLLRPGGSAYFVMEDMAPSWTELLRDAAKRVQARLARRHRQADVQLPLSEAFTAKLRGTWPVQADHIRITEAELHRWTAGSLKLQGRSWTGGYRTYGFVKP